MQRMLRRKPLIFLVLLAGIIGMAGQAEASDGMRGDRCIVAEGTQISEDFYFFCRILEVHGTINGDLIGVASEVTVAETGVVGGDIWVGGGRLLVQGRVGDDVHFAGITASVSAHARFTNPRIDLASIALNVEIEKDAVLPGDLLFYGYQARVQGTVGGDVDFRGEALLVDGFVLGQVHATVGDPRRSPDVPRLPFYDVSFENPGLWVGPDALLAGDVTYRSAAPSLIPPGVPQGTVVFEQTGSPHDITKVKKPDAAAKILWDYFKESLRDFVTLMLIGVTALYFVPGAIRRPAAHVRRRTVPAVGWGLITFMLSIPTLIVVVVVGLILVGILYLIKLSGLTLMVGIGLLIITAVMAGGFSFLLFYMGRLVISFVIGQLLYRYVFENVEMTVSRRWIATLALGTAIYVLSTNMPVPALGLIIELISALAGIGAVVMYVRELTQTSAVITLMPRLAAPRQPVLALPTPQPPLDEAADEPAPPGMDNLPEGFHGFDDTW